MQAGSVDSEFMSLESQAIAYLLGRNGATKQRLANFSGCRLEIDPNKDGSTGKIEIIGTPDERKLARLCIDITLQQRNNGKVSISEKDLLADGNVTTLDVDTDAVGFVLGAKGATLRQFETQFQTFMFFDNDCLPGTNQKRLYILGTKESRNRALAECQNAVEYKMSGKSGGQVSSWRDRGGPRYDQGYTRRSRSRSGGRGERYDGRYDDRRRSPPRRYDERDRDRRRDDRDRYDDRDRDRGRDRDRYDDRDRGRDRDRY